MDDPEAGLARTIQRVRAGVLSDAQGTPRPLDRAAIYRLLGPLADQAGRGRRTALDAAAASYVLPQIWKAFAADDHEGMDASSPRGLLATADRVIAGQFVDRRVYEEAFDYCMFLLAVRLGGTDAGDKERAAFAHLACAATLRTALGDDPFLNLAIRDSTRDGDIGFSDADAASWAAESVAAEIGSWNVHACRLFWLYWLDEATALGLRAR